jgi:peptidoglycan lytic transglycosylase D
VIKRTLPVIATVFIGTACARPSQAPVGNGPAPAVQRDSSFTTITTVTTVTKVTTGGPSASVAQQGSAEPAVAPTKSTGPTSAADVSRLNARDVTRRAADVFGDSAVVRADSVDDAPEAPTWDIDVRPYETTDRVEHYVRLFSTTAKEHIAERLERGTKYEPMIRSKLREGGLPEDMYYLALVESGFDPNAYSRAAAVGMWQFMTSTARDMGLRVDWWVDERRDPIRSTTAAVRFIKDLKEQFGSLYLAAAAYNGGPGRIARGLTRYADDFEGTTGDDLFFALADKDYLRYETREYVPQLIAAALIAKEPERYGFKITPQPLFTYDSVRVGPGTPLAAIGRAASASVSQIQELNPQILRGMTPPRDSSSIRIPAGTADSFAVAFAALPKEAKTGLFTVESKKGQTLSSIAEKNDVSTRQLSLYNPNLKKLKSGRLVPGQRVIVPTAAVASAASSVPDPSIERYGSSSSKSVVTHVVKSGETLGGIAKKYHTTTASIMKANGMKRAMIFPGQSIVVKGAAKGGKTSKKPTVAAAKNTVKKTAKGKKKRQS